MVCRSVSLAGLSGPLVLLPAFTTIALAACAPAEPAKTPLADVSTSALTAPEGSQLQQTCTPTGPELCFNAIDDNCNGVVDEGCGLQTGLLQFTIAWNASAADVNLSLIAPGDEHVPNGLERSSKSGFHLDRDCPGEDGCGGQNVENISFDGQQPPLGPYVAWITLVDLHGAEAPVQVHFSARLGSRTVAFDANLSPGDDTSKKKFTFAMP
jgi:tRNA (guanosine-2'-O-)-methyltransferase